MDFGYSHLQLVRSWNHCLGYQESRNEPNLFYYQKFGDVVFFMNMRGTRQVKIWEDTCPLFYWNIDLTMPDWAKRRMLKEE